MPDLPPDPERLRAIERWLDEQVVENETVGVYLRLQLDAVREALAKAEGETPAQPESKPEPATPPRRSKRAAPERKPGPLHTFTQRAGGGASTGYNMERRAQAVGDDRVLIHAPDCPHAGAGDPIDAHDARAALVEGVEACPFCRPDTELGIEG